MKSPICFGYLSADQRTGHVTQRLLAEACLLFTLSRLVLQVLQPPAARGPCLPVVMKGFLALKASAAQAGSVRFRSVKPCRGDC